MITVFLGRLWSRLVAFGTCLFLLCACALHGLAFRQDKRVTIVSPGARTVVTTPFTLRWVVHGFPYGPNTIQGGNDYFAVFIDRQPMPPGAGLRALADDACKRTPGCPDERWLEVHYVYLTAQTQLTVQSLPSLLPVNTKAGVKEDHEIDIVLMDASNHRIGEAVFYVEVFRTITGFGS